MGPADRWSVLRCVVAIAGVYVTSAAAQTPDTSFLNSGENEISLTGSATEIWLERRGGAWGDDYHASRVLYSWRGSETDDWQPLAPFEPVMSGGDGGDLFYDKSNDTLYFTSTRAHPELGSSAGNLWRVARRRGEWEVPEALPIPVNGPGAEYSPILAGKHLYFAAHRSGDGDLYRARELEHGWEVEKLGPALNTTTGEWNLWVSDDETLLLFEASRRVNNVSPAGDLYASRKDNTGRWLPAIPLHDVNGPGSELNVREIDGHLFYASNSEHSTHTDIYSVPLCQIMKSVSKAYD